MSILADAVLNLNNSGGLIHSLFAVLIIGICVAIIWAVGRYFITKITQNALAMTVWNGFFVLVGAIIVINFLMSLDGHAFMVY
jgi:hypothetical protein